MEMHRWLASDEHEWSLLLEQELAIADACSKKNLHGRLRKGATYMHCMTRETQRLLEAHSREASECVQLRWKEQVQVAQWACQALENGWWVHVAYYHAQQQEQRIPYMYFIFDAHAREMKGIWKSLYGTLWHIEHREAAPYINSVQLISWAFEQLAIEPGTLIRVAARIGLELAFEKHGNNCFQLQYVERRIPRTPQGASVHAQFVWKLN